MTERDIEIALQVDLRDISIWSHRNIEWTFYPSGKKMALKIDCFFKGHFEIKKRNGEIYCYQCMKQIKPANITPDPDFEEMKKLIQTK
jgi:hypothetical protein